MIEGFLESLHASGVFTGWLRDTGDPEPVIVEVRVAATAQPVARAAANAFRPDLLRGGHGHGHYGFRARLLAGLPPGTAHFELFLPRRGQGVRTRLEVPPVTLAGQSAVEALLRPDSPWTTADLLPALTCLDPDGELARLGAARFIDAAYRFALHRWPSPGEAEAYLRALADGGASATDLLRELLTSRERQDLGPDLISPWDPGFPFTPAGGT
jgi:hypothetical protein